MFFDRTHSTLFDKDTQFMGSPICFVDKCIFLGFSISRDILNRDIQSSINTFNRKCNEVRRLDFTILNSDIKSKLISIICMDLYGCSLWNFGSNYVETFYTAWRKAIRDIWKLPFNNNNNIYLKSNIQ